MPKQRSADGFPTRGGDDKQVFQVSLQPGRPHRWQEASLRVANRFTEEPSAAELDSGVLKGSRKMESDVRVGGNLGIQMVAKTRDETGKHRRLGRPSVADAEIVAGEAPGIASIGSSKAMKSVQAWALTQRP